MKEFLQQFNRKAWFGAGILFFYIAIAIYGVVAIDDPQAYVDVPLSPPSSKNWFGTTGQGQDVFAQTIAGTSQTLLLSFFIGAAVTLIGAMIGISSAIYRGRFEPLIPVVINIFLVIPGLPLAIVLASYLPSGAGTLAFVLIFTGWAWNSRVLRAQALSIAARDFVVAARLSGENKIRLIFYEILPNMASLLVSVFIGSTIYAIGAQVGLEFLGLGDISQVSWGTNLYWAANDAALLTKSWWTFVPTGLSIALVAFALSLINFSIDELTNPSLRAERIWHERKPQHIKDGDLITPVLARISV